MVAPVAAPAAQVDGGKIKDILLSIVEERTGYPSDMVGLEQNLEADLGIDSIKRVEIVGALLQTLPPAYGSALGEARSQLNTRATLADMLKMLEGLDVGEVAVPFESAEASPKTVPVTASHSPRHIVVPEEEDIPEQALRQFEPGYFILTADDHGLALRLQQPQRLHCPPPPVTRRSKRLRADPCGPGSEPGALAALSLNRTFS